MKSNIYRRDLYLSRIRPFIGHEQIKVLTGLRRCGKTMVLHMIKEELIASGIDESDIFLIDMESNMGRKYHTGEELYDYIKEWYGSDIHLKYILLDEIQQVEGWERCIRSLKSDFDIDIYLTGSSSKMLSGELATHLAGRYVEFRIHPFSFTEVSDILGNKTDINSLFMNYLRYGGMPLIVMNEYNLLMNSAVMDGMYDSVVIRDICERNGIKNSIGLRNVLRYVMSEIGHNMSSTNIANYLKSQKNSISHDTILDYLTAAEDAMFINRVNRQDLRGKEILKTDYKFYMEDHGFRLSSGMDNTVSIDQVLENIVFNELKRRGYSVTVGKGRNSEIDFVADMGGKREYYQVSYLLASEETVEREFGALQSIKDNHPKFVLSMDSVDMGRDGIVHKNIVDWLLESGNYPMYD